MQTNPVLINSAANNGGGEMLNLWEELQYLKKIYKAIYISICHFTIATELRLLSS
jgi:hypothetical protein